MMETRGQSWSTAAEARRRELPIAIALALLTGGLAAIIIGALWPVGWAALMAGTLIGDVEIYRRAELTGAGARGRMIPALAIWNFLSSALYAVLPGALWFDGAAAAAAAAMILWGAAVFRQVLASPGLSWVTAAGIAPPLLSMIGAPLAASAMSASVDWDLAAIAVVGGGALLAYVAAARFSGMRAEARLAEAERDLRRLAGFERLIAEQAGVALYTIDRDFKLVSVGDRLAADLDLAPAEAIGRALYDVHPWMPAPWRRLYAEALNGRAGRLSDQSVFTDSGERWFETEARPLRDAQGRYEGALLYLRETGAPARFGDRAHEARLRRLQAGARAVLCEVDPAAARLEWFGDPRPILGGAYTFEAFADGELGSVFEEDRARLTADWAGLLDGRCDAAEARVRKADGKVGWVRIKSQACGDGRWSLLFKDVTQRTMHEIVLGALIRQGEASMQTQNALVEQVLGVRVPAPDKGTVFSAGGDDSFDEFQRRLTLLCDEMTERDALLREAIATLVEARKAADSASAAKSDFLANMSHELRTPLNAIIGYSEMLLEDAEAEGAGTSADLERVLSSARALLRLINEILDLSKIEAGRLEVSLGEFDLTMMIKEAAETIRPAAEKNANALVIECSPDLGLVQSDGFKLNQCLLNLLANANKFTNQGQVTVRARRVRAGVRDAIEIAVADTGIGLSEQQIKRLFQPFQQADSSTTRKYGGTGLGLAITKRTMQVLGGDVEVASAQGEGAVFTLRFPAELGALEAASAPEDASAPPAEAISVLVVDDEADARDLAARTLGRLGCAVRGAASAGEALAEVARAAPSIVLLDIHLPDEDGWSVLARLRADPATARIPVIVVSVEDERQRALALGACEQLVKPVRRDLLTSAVLRFARAPRPANASASTSPSLLGDIAQTA